MQQIHVAWYMEWLGLITLCYSKCDGKLTVCLELCVLAVVHECVQVSLLSVVNYFYGLRCTMHMQYIMSGMYIQYLMYCVCFSTIMCVFSSQRELWYTCIMYSRCKQTNHTIMGGLYKKQRNCICVCMCLCACSQVCVDLCCADGLIILWTAAPLVLLWMWQANKDWIKIKKYRRTSPREPAGERDVVCRLFIPLSVDYWKCWYQHSHFHTFGCAKDEHTKFYA